MLGKLDIALVDAIAEREQTRDLALQISEILKSIERFENFSAISSEFLCSDILNLTERSQLAKMIPKEFNSSKLISREKKWEHAKNLKLLGDVEYFLIIIRSKENRLFGLFVHQTLHGNRFFQPQDCFLFMFEPHSKLPVKFLYGPTEEEKPSVSDFQFNEIQLHLSKDICLSPDFSFCQIKYFKVQEPPNSVKLNPNVLTGSRCVIEFEQVEVFSLQKK